ncbi:hypothetical protein [Flagellimonas allohymeniacidonis]|uniref:Uncharacterized protein n=1 Tax=Flagellimonas allohymeniacidonis TaxID=2517819 RepID=A0A4Q8QGG6_9FLAO|nr:hypothetical protein [Allomuricauda hymeniacidonis]TAI48994.1 hypothetical protein EW142_04145 [Allomuricauda hymeniacidonis]
METAEMESPVMGHEHNSIIMVTNQVRKRVDEINGAFEAVDEFFGEKPTVAQRKEILKKGADYVSDKLRPKFPFPNATEEFNYEAMGIDPKGLINKLYYVPDRYRTLQYAELDGIWMDISEKGKQEIKSKYEIIANTESQVETLKFARELSELLNRNKAIAGKLGFHSHNSEARHRTIDILKVVNVTSEGFRPSAKGIKNF